MEALSVAVCSFLSLRKVEHPHDEDSAVLRYLKRGLFYAQEILYK